MPSSEIARLRTVVRRHVDGLNGGNRPALRRGDALLHGAHVRGQRRLVTHGGRNTAQESRHLGAGLRETENIVHEEKNVRPRLIAELLGERQTSKRDTSPRAGRLVHLAIDQRHLRFFKIVRLDHVGFDHLMVEVVALTGPFPNTCEHRIARVHFRDVVNEFHDENGLANTGTAKQADLAAFCVGGEQIDHLDTGFKHFGFRRLFGELGCWLVDRPRLGGTDGAFLVDGLTHDVENSAQRRVSDRHGDRTACVGHGLSAHQTFRGVHRDRTDSIFTKVLGHLQHEAVAVVVCFERVENLRQVILELDVNDRADDLCKFADCFCHVVSPICSTALPRRK